MPALIALILFLGCRSPLWSAQPTLPKKASVAPSLPESILAMLNQEYPAWKLAPVTPQVQREFIKHKINRSPSLVLGDFDHDGKMDYAVQLALTTPGQEEQIIMVFMARDNAYEETIVQSMGPDPTTYLWVSKMAQKSILMVLGGPIGETVYAFEDGKFQEIKSPEDPDHPDPSIPRAPEVP